MGRWFLGLLIAHLCVSVGEVNAQEFPTKPIEVLVGYGPGGGSDLSIRLVESAVSKYLGQKLVVVNRPGAAGSIMFNQFVRAIPDGYTLAIGSTATLAIQPHVASVLYAPHDYVPIIQLTNIPNLLVVPSGSPFKTLGDVIDFAKKTPPGRVKAGITSPGTTIHLSLVGVEKLYNVKFTHIPHKSSGDIIVAVMGGHIDVASADLAAAGPKIKAGLVRPLGVFSSERLSDFRDIATIKEQGADVQSGFFNMLIAPKATPERIITVLHDAFKKALEDSEVIEKARGAGIPIEYLGTKASRDRVDQYYEISGTLLGELGLKKK